MSSEDPGSAQQAKAAAEEKEVGETWGAFAHLGFSAVFFLAAVVLVAVSHSEDLGRNMDFVKLYTYTKASHSKSDISRDITAYTKEVSGAWINDETDASKCLDMTSFWFPGYTFAAGADPRIAGSCVFTINLKLGPMEGQLQIGSVTTTQTSGCAQGQYTPLWTVANSDGVITGAPKITIAADKTFTFEDTVIGYDFKTFDADFKSCMSKRRALANFVHTKTGCEYGYASPMCTCVRAFTARVESWGAKLNWKPKGAMLLGDVLVGGVERCMDLRRTHDVREATDKEYARSSALLIFAVALFFNGIMSVLMRYAFFRGSVWFHVGFFLIYFAAVLSTGLADGDGSVAEFWTVLILTLPAFLVHGGYLVLLSGYFRGQTETAPPPFLHPVTFDVCFSALNLFTLTERGVVQLEYLLVELLKGHAVAAVYIGLVWYHRYGKDREVLTSEFVQQAYVLLYAVGLLGSVSGVVTPYPAKKCFELHWLLPGAFTYVAYATLGWSQHLKMSTKLNAPAGGVVHNYNAATGFLVLILGAILWGHFLAEHIQLYGVKHFAYPVQGDPQSYVVTRQLLLPGVSL